MIIFSKYLDIWTYLILLSSVFNRRIKVFNRIKVLIYGDWNVWCRTTFKALKSIRGFIIIFTYN